MIDAFNYPCPNLSYLSWKSPVSEKSRPAMPARNV